MKKEDLWMLALGELGIKPDPWQEEILRYCSARESWSVAIRSGHGVGKTSLAAWVIMLFMFFRDHAKVPCTAPTHHQLNDILWPELHKWNRGAFEKVLDWHPTSFRHKAKPEEWFAVTRSAERAENLSGFHAKNLLYVIDEGSGVDNAIYEPIEGALTTGGACILLISNPTKPSGYFFDAFHRFKEHFKTYHIKPEGTRQSQEYRDRMAKKWGKSSNIYRIRVNGEFPVSSEDTLIPINVVQSCVNLGYKAEGKKVLSCDPARFGDDQTGYCIKHGRKITKVFKVAKEDTMQTTGRVIKTKETEGDVNETRVDSIGIGAGVVDRLREQSHQVTEVNVAESARDKKTYANLRAELWGEGAKALRNKEIDIPDNEDLIGQLSSAKFKFDSKGRLLVEKKADMKKRGFPSPDIADAFLMSLPEVVGSHSVPTWVESF